MLAILGSTDITKLIDRESYDIQSETQYKEWQDGNGKYNRIAIRERISGSFTVLCRAGWTMTDAAFLELLEANTENDITTITLYVTNKAKMEAITCYIKVTTDEVKFFSDDDRGTVYKLEIKER